MSTPHKIRETADEFINRVLSPEWVADLMEELGHEIRGGLFHPAMTIWLMMLQRLSGEKTLSEAVHSFREGSGGVLTKRCRGDVSRVSSGTGGFSQARTRLPEEAVEAMVDRLNEAIIGSHPHHLWQGRHAYIIDGTDFRVRAEGDVKKEFPPSHAEKRESAWSTVRSVIATHVVTGIALRAVNGPMYGKKAVSEVGLVPDVISQLPSHSIVLADRGLGTFSVAFTAVKEGHDVLLRLTEQRAKQALGRRIPQRDGTTICIWKPGQRTQKKYPEISIDDEIPGRIIKHTVHRPGFEPQVLFLFTTLTLPTDQIISLYALRWNIETDFRSMKTALKMELLYVRSAPMIRKEIALGVAAYNMVRHLLAYSAHEANLQPREVSFKYYASRVRLVGMRLATAASLTNEQRENILARLSDRLYQIKHPNRPRGRPSRPRKVLHKPRPFPCWTTKARKMYRKKKLKLAKWH